MWAALWGRVQGWLLMAGAVLLVLVGAYGAGSRAARRSAEVERAEQEVRAAKAAQKAQDSARRGRDAIDQEIRNLPAGESARRLREHWNRDR